MKRRCTPGYSRHASCCRFAPCRKRATGSRGGAWAFQACKLAVRLAVAAFAWAGFQTEASAQTLVPAIVTNPAGEALPQGVSVFGLQHPGVTFTFDHAFHLSSVTTWFRSTNISTIVVAIMAVGAGETFPDGAPGPATAIDYTLFTPPAVAAPDSGSTAATEVIIPFETELDAGTYVVLFSPYDSGSVDLAAFEASTGPTVAYFDGLDGMGYRWVEIADRVPLVTLSGHYAVVIPEPAATGLWLAMLALAGATFRRRRG